jgi:protein O-mannosyl-transferase
MGVAFPKFLSVVGQHLQQTSMVNRKWFIALSLAFVTLAIYWPVRGFDLVYFDDPLLLTDCPEVRAGLTWHGIKWAFTEVWLANWNPLTSLSFMAVAEFFGVAPGPHHLANALLHAANAALLFLLLQRLTGATWRSALAAALFAWHPLRVESVAWIAERKDVLCGFFFLLALFAYVWFAERPPAKGGGRGRFFWMSVGAYLLALLSKPMAVTLPFVLLLLDFWPLNRMTEGRWKMGGWKNLVIEKWPFFSLTFGFCLATYFIQRNHAATTSWEVLGLSPRVANAIASYLDYPAQLFWPVNLAAIYPYPAGFDFWEIGLKAVVLALISLACLFQIQRRPQWLFGWLWYLGMALPVIGLVQVGEQARADRYTYLPLIGLVVALVWTMAEVPSRIRGGKFFFTVLTIFILSVLVAVTERQLSYWRNTIALFEHNVAVTPDNGSAHFTLGLGFEHAGDTNRAITCYRVAKILSPNDRQTPLNLASLLIKRGEFAAAEKEYAEMIDRHPEDFSTRLCLADALALQGRDAEAVAQLNEVLRLNPDLVEALNNLAWQLATSPHAELRDAPRAVLLANRACELTKYQKTIYVGTLGAAYAAAGRYDEAVANAEKACDLAAKNGEADLLLRNRELLERYRMHKQAGGG